jgi:aromatic ring-opening dioxygenase catalytic subunit (LigB family)
MGMKSTPVVEVWQSLTLTVAPTPVHFFSHGSTMMLGEESESATYWKKAGDEALSNGIKGVIMMVGPPADPNELS